MLNTSALPTKVIDDLKSRGHSLEIINQMTPKKAFDEYCNWNGLIGWGDHLWNMMHKIKVSEDISPNNNEINTD
jgi:hypothetical protein